MPEYSFTDDDSESVAPWWEGEPPDVDFELPWPHRRTFYSQKLDVEDGWSTGDIIGDLSNVDVYDVNTHNDHRQHAKVNEANLISSVTLTGKHAPALDIDFEARLVPSKTDGHYHLYLDKEMPWWKYRILLKVLAWVGIIEQGYYRASVQRHMTFLRWNYWSDVARDAPKRSDKYLEAQLRITERSLRRKLASPGSPSRSQ